MAGIDVFNCPHCGQIVHPTNCICGDHDDSDLADINKEARLGMGLLNDWQRMKLDLEAERVSRGLSPKPEPGSHGTNAVVINGPSISGGPKKICSKCNGFNDLDAVYCDNCGNRF
jgi:hypothetical protein